MEIFPPNKLPVATACLGFSPLAIAFLPKKTWAKSTQGAALISPLKGAKRKEIRVCEDFLVWPGSQKKKHQKWPLFLEFLIHSLWTTQMNVIFPLKMIKFLHLVNCSLENKLAKFTYLKSGQIITFHQPRFDFRDFPLPHLHIFGAQNSCEVATECDKTSLKMPWISFWTSGRKIHENFPEEVFWRLPQARRRLEVEFLDGTVFCFFVFCLKLRPWWFSAKKKNSAKQPP